MSISNGYYHKFSLLKIIHGCRKWWKIKTRSRIIIISLNAHVQLYQLAVKTAACRWSSYVSSEIFSKQGWPPKTNRFLSSSLTTSNFSHLSWSWGTIITPAFFTATAYLSLSLVGSLHKLVPLPKLPPSFQSKYDSHECSKLPQTSAITIPIPFWTTDDLFHSRCTYKIGLLTHPRMIRPFCYRDKLWCEVYYWIFFPPPIVAQCPTPAAHAFDFSNSSMVVNHACALCGNTAVWIICFSTSLFLSSYC